MIYVSVSKGKAILKVMSEFNNQYFYTTFNFASMYGYNFYLSMNEPADWKNGHIYELNGLNETNVMALACRAANSAKNEGKILKGQFKHNQPVTIQFNPKPFFKGTTFHGKSENSFGYIAKLLKAGLDGFVIKNGVKWEWTSGDLVNYITLIQKATFTVQTISNNNNDLGLN